MRKIDYIVVHCSDSPEGRNDTTEDIRRWHVKGNGWSDIGYHFVVELDGTINAGRKEEVVGAHVKNFNKNSIGVCYVGGREKNSKKPKDTRTQAQKEALVQLLTLLQHKYPTAKIVGHRDLDKSKACPSFDAKTEYADL